MRGGNSCFFGVYNKTMNNNTAETEARIFYITVLLVSRHVRIVSMLQLKKGPHKALKTFLEPALSQNTRPCSLRESASGARIAEATQASKISHHDKSIPLNFRDIGFHWQCNHFWIHQDGDVDGTSF